MKILANFAFALALPVLAADLHPNYDDDVKPILRRYCFQCHSVSEARSGLVLEAYAGVMRGGSSGDAVVPGRASASLLYHVIAQEKDGVPRMPQGGAKLAEPLIGTVREWIQLGAPENSASQPKPQTGPSLTSYKPSDLNHPAGAPAMPGTLRPLAPAKAGPHPHPVTALAASPWAPLVAVAGHERITLYNSTTRTLIGELAFPEGIPFVLRFSRDGSKLLAAGGRPVQAGKVVLFDVATGVRSGVFGDEHDEVLAADLSPDGKLVALGGPGKLVKVYNVSDGTLAYTIAKHTDWITAIEFSPDGSKLATGDRSAGLHLWEASTGRIFVSLAEHKDAITSLSWRSDGALLASASEDGTVVIWNAIDGFPAATIAKAHEAKPTPGVYGKPASGVLSVAYSPDGTLATVGRDLVVKQWTGDGKPKSASPARDALPTRVAVTFDGKFVLAGDERGKLFNWDGKQATLVAVAAAAPAVKQ